MPQDPFDFYLWQRKRTQDRRLLALCLSQSPSALTALFVSRAIAENRSPYHRTFREVEHSASHGELTPFVMTLPGYVDEAQRSTLTSPEICGAD